MNARSVNALAGVIHAAMQTHQTAAGIAVAVEAAGLLMSPETAAELAQLRASVQHHANRADSLSRQVRSVRAERQEHESASRRRLLAWQSARQRAAGHWEAAGWVRDERVTAEARVAELEQQLATVRGAVAEAVMCDDVACLVNSHMAKIELALGGLPLLPADGGEPR